MRLMDVGAFIGVMLGLFFGGLGISYGGYSVHLDYPLMALLSYVFGGGCVAASVVLTFLRIDRSERQKHIEPQLAAPALARNTSPKPNQTDAQLGTLTKSSSGERIFVNVTPRELSNLFENHISFQAQKLVEPYLGKWLTVAGSVSDVGRVHNGQWLIFIRNDMRNSLRISGIQVALYFREDRSGRLPILSRDSFITAVGRLVKVEVNSLSLEDCELVNNV
jgi:hypothetical protein